MKRTLDFLLALMLLPFLMLFGAVISLIIILKDRHSPFFFQQKRVGKNGKEFYCLKFQALKPPRSEDDINDKDYDKVRETNLGAFLRDHGLDELPQILNIIIGKMSFVGPRPYLKKNLKTIEELNPEIIKDVKDWERKRSNVLPGLSDWHQIHSLGSGVIKYDLEYLQRPAFAKHLKVLIISTYIMLIGKKRYFK